MKKFTNSFDMQSHYGVFYGYMRLKMQEIDLIEKIARRKKTKLAEGVENVKTDCRNLVPFQYTED